MQKKELTKNKQLKENIRGVMGLSLLFNPTQLSLFEKYLLKKEDKKRIKQNINN